MTPQLRRALLDPAVDAATLASRPAWIDGVTVIATTFQRPRCVVRLVASIRRFYPGIQTLVCDSSPEPLFPEGTTLPGNLTWLVLPAGLEPTVGAGRNHLLARVATPYFFLCDDDHVLTAHTDLAAMHAFLERHRYDIVGGCQGKDDYGTAVFDQVGDVVYQRFYRHRGLIEPGVVRCDRVSNTFLARTDAVRPVQWEHRVYANEHAEFFLRATRHGLRIAQMAEVYVDHRRDCEEATGLGRLLPWLLPHRDRGYLRAMVRANALGLRSRAARERERAHCFEKNGIRRIESVSRSGERAALMALLHAR